MIGSNPSRTADVCQTAAANATPTFDPLALLHAVRLQLMSQGVIPPGHPEDTAAAVEACRALLLAEHVVPLVPSQSIASRVAALADDPNPLSNVDSFPDFRPSTARSDGPGYLNTGWMPTAVALVEPAPHADSAVTAGGAR